MGTDLAIIDPATAKAFEIRRYAIGLRTRLDYIDDLDTLSELSATMLACRHRLRSLHEEVVQANRTHVLIMQRVGQLLSAYHPNDGESFLRSRHSLSYRSRARMIAANPEIVAQALNQPTVSVTGIIRKIYQRRAAEAEQEFMRTLPAKLNEMRVKQGDWWRVGDRHLVYCGSYHTDDFGAQRDKLEPVLTYVDTWGDSLWNHHWFSGVSPAYAYTDTAQLCTGIPHWMTIAHRRMTTFIADNSRGGGSGIIALPTLFHDHRGFDGARAHLMRDVVRLQPQPNSPHDDHKPLSLVNRVIEWMTDPGELVFDPKLGYGLTLRSCELLGRRFIGAAFEPQECAVAIIRSGLPAERVS